MQTENLPTEELKKFGIINEDLVIFKKTEIRTTSKNFCKATLLSPTTTKIGQPSNSRKTTPD
jgi:hypothetical protein